MTQCGASCGAKNSRSKKTVVASEQDRPKVARFRDRWNAHQHRISLDRLVFLDETWIKTNTTRLRGWFTRGTALVAKVPHGHWKTLTFIGALRHDKIAAPCVFDGPIDANTFVAWVEQSLVPALEPGDVVVLDNLGSHKDARARQAIRAAGARLLFLPLYSPDLNPIEMVFSKLKTLFRKADRRTVGAGPMGQASSARATWRKRPGARSEPCSTASRPTNAPLSSETPAMVLKPTDRL